MFVSTESIKSPRPVDNRILTSNGLFDIYYFMNKDNNSHTNTFKCMVDDFTSLQLKEITVNIIDDDKQSYISNFCSYFLMNSIKPMA